MKLELTTENGTSFALNSFQKNNSPELVVEATIYLKSGEVKFIVVPYVLSKEGYKVITSDSPVKIGDTKQYLYLALRPEDVSIVNKYFEEVKKRTHDLQKKRRAEEKRAEREKLFETAKTTGKPVKLYSYTAVRERIFEIAKTTGKPIKLYSYSIDCEDPNADCDLDIVTVFAMPDGTAKEEVSHTWQVGNRHYGEEGGRL